MKIIGAEGLDASTVRAEIDRGARFVMYIWCVSFLVMTVKRPSSVYFVRAAQSRALRSWPFTLTSLLLGWWGFPWGLIYTFEALFKNLGGGTDVTEEVMHHVFGASTPPSSLAATPAERSPNVSAGSLLKAFGLVGAALFVVFAIWSTYLGQNMPVALVNGSGHPYSVEIAGKRHALPASVPLQFTLPEGRHTITFKLPGGSKQTREIEVHTPFWSRPFDRQVAVLNPDEGAVVFEETTEYRPETDRNFSPNHVVVHTGNIVYLLSKPDHFLEEFPEHMQLRNGRVVTARRINVVRDTHPAELAPLLTERLGRAATSRFILRQGALRPDDEKMLQLAFSQLEPAEGRRFFEQHLADRPVRVEWHRYYQHFAEYNLPEVDLKGQYESWIAQEPQSGALLYLAGRVAGDFADGRAYYERALAAAQPCPYAYNGLAFGALGVGDFATALDLLRKAEAAGVASDTLKHNKRNLLIATGRLDDLLLETRAARQASPGNFELVALEIQLNGLIARGRAASEALIREYSRINDRKLSPENRAQAETYLRALIAYGEGDEAAYAALLAGMPGPVNALYAAITRHDHTEAAKQLSALPRSSGRMWLLAYLAAMQTGDTSAAEGYFTRAVEAFSTESYEMKRISRQLQAGAMLDAAAFELIPMYPDEKCVLATALGLRDPTQRATYFRCARLMNVSLDFPHQFLLRILGREQASPSSL